MPSGLSYILVAALQSSAQTIATVSLLAGVASHQLVFRPFEIDGYAWQLFFTYLITFCVLIFGHVYLAGYSVILAWARALRIATAYNAGAVTSMIIYRVFFHPLNRFPGPFWAKVSRFHAMKNAAKRLQAYKDIQNLHDEYGDVVRVGPRELSINRLSAIKAIYEHPTRTTRSPVHKLRKKAWERGFGFRALAVYAPRVKAKVDLLLSKIAAHNGSPIDMTEYAMFFGFDVMGDIGFSKDFQMLESGSEHPAIKGLHDSMLAIGVLGTAPWLLSMVSKVPGAAAGFSRFVAWCHQQLQEKRKAVAHEAAMLKDQDPRDVISWLIKAFNEGDSSAPPGEMAMQEDARLLIVTGSDTTSTVITNALYFLARNPDSHRRLQAAVEEQFPGGIDDWTWEKSIPYVDYVIQETLRLKPSVPGGLPRVVPPQGLMIDDDFIPGGAVIAVPTYTIQRDPRFWPDAHVFKPERWEDLSTEKAPWIPFTRGQWACPGRNFAMMELRMVISRIALQYNIAIAEEDLGDKFDEEAKDTFTLALSPLRLVFSPK